jgi:hypothetical protein
MRSSANIFFLKAAPGSSFDYAKEEPGPNEAPRVRAAAQSESAILRLR